LIWVIGSTTHDPAPALRTTTTTSLRRHDPSRYTLLISTLCHICPLSYLPSAPAPTPSQLVAHHSRLAVANAGGSIGWQWAAEFIGRQAAVHCVLFEGEGWYSARELIIVEVPAEADCTSHMTHQHVATRSTKEQREKREQHEYRGSMKEEGKEEEEEEEEEE
jgi:hypothetical protein